jgi:ribosomal protein L11 methyltransferase
VNRPRYTRYALHVTAGNETADVAGRAAAPEAGPPALAHDGPLAAQASQPVDDWSGAAAHEHVPDAQALEYAHPAAADAILALQPAGWQEKDGGRTLVFWLEDGAATKAAAALKHIGTLGRLEVQREPPGWETAWQRFHKPHAIGRLYVRPPWYPAREDLLDIAVEAGLAFGTGGHASTRQCLELIQTLAPGSLLDLGSGSGVVSFAALRLGFSPVTGIEIDPVAVHSAAGNAAMNGLDPVFLVGDATDSAYPLPAADVVVANIALRPILRLAERWRGGGASVVRSPLPRDLLLAGLLVEQAGEALAAFPAFNETARSEDGTWLTLHLSRRA